MPTQTCEINISPTFTFALPRKERTVDVSDTSFSATQSVRVTLVEIQRLVVLDNELRRNRAPFLISATMLGLSAASATATKYWAMAVLATLPFALRFGEHEATLRAAKRRIVRGRSK